MTEIEILEDTYVAQVASLFAGVVKNSVLPRWRSAATIYAVCFKVINANCAVTVRLANKTCAWTIDLFSVQILETR